MSRKTTAKGIKAPKAVFTGHHEEIQAETVQLSIDVDSVKEAVSKLPGFKLPKVDTSGVPIPEEITVIDANAQRISVKTPTKVVDSKVKHEAHFTQFDITASPEISKTTVKLPKITPADFTSEKLLVAAKVDIKKPQKEHKTKTKQSDKDIKTEECKRDIVIPGKESAPKVSILAQESGKTQVPEAIQLEYESAATKESDKKSKKGKITMPSFGIGKPDIRIPDFGIDLPKQIISEKKGDAVKEEKTTVLQEEKISESETRKGNRQTGGFVCDVKMPEIDGIEYIDSAEGSPARTDGGIRLTGFDINLEAKPNADISFPEIRHDVKDVEAEQTVKLPKFGAITSDIRANISDGDKNVIIDGAKKKTLEGEGKGYKFKVPNLGISMPKVKGPKVDLSLSKKDTEAKAEIKLPEAHQTDVSLGNELDGQGSKFKMPKFGIQMPKIKGPEFDLSLSKRDADVKLPEAKVHLPAAPETDVTLGRIDVSIPEQKIEVQKTELEIKSREIEGEIDGQGSKFKMPKLGISMPKVKGPEFDVSLSKKDVDITLPEAKGKLPDVELKDSSAKIEIRAPEIEVGEKDAGESPSKFKMPAFKMPKFGASAPRISADVSSKIKDTEISETQLKSPGKGVAVDITTPNTDIVGPSLDVKATAAELDGKGSKFKMPKFGISLPKVKGPEIDFSSTKKDTDVALSKATAEVHLPIEPGVQVEVKAPEIALHKDVEQSPSKFKMPSFKLPKFEAGTPNVSVEMPDMDRDVKIDGVSVNIPEERSSVNIVAPSIDVEGPSLDIKTIGAEHEGKGSKFKMPHLGFSMPKVKGPKIDLSLSKKHTDITLPEAEADVKLPEVDLGEVHVSSPDAKMKVPEAKVEVKLPEAPKIAAEVEAPEYEAEIDKQSGKFKMPKFGMKILSKKAVDGKLSEVTGDVKLPEVNLGEVDVSIPEMTLEVEKPKLEMQTEGQVDGQGGKFNIPKFGIKVPKIKGPEIDFSLSKKDTDVQFGMSMLKVKGPEFHLGHAKKDVDVTTPEVKADINLPDVELEAPSTKVEIKAPDIEVMGKDTEGSSSAFKMPNLSIVLPNVKGPDINWSLPKKETHITLPETEAEVRFPESSKLDVSLGTAEVLIPEATVEVQKPEVQIKTLQTDVELEGQGGKFKMPKFGITMPKVKGPEIDLNVKHKEAPDIECELDGQGSKFKMPKFGIKMPKVKGPEFDASMSKKDANAEVQLPEAPQTDVTLGSIDVSIPEARIEVKKPELEIKPPHAEGELDGQGSKFKMPSFGVSLPKVKGHEFDFSLSKTDVDVTLPEAKAEVSIPGADIKEPSAKVDYKAAEIEAQLGEVRGSPSKFKLPTFKFPKFGVTTPSVGAEVPDTEKEIKIDGADMHISVPNTDVDVPEVKAEVQMPDAGVKEPLSGIEAEVGVEVDAKQKKRRFSLPKFSFSKPSIKAPEVDVSCQDVNVAIPEGKVEVKGGKVDMKPPECELEVDEQESKFKVPNFGITMPKLTGPEIDLSLAKKDVDVTLPEAKAEVQLPDVKLDKPSSKIRTVNLNWGNKRQ
uniref:Uncharacterized protein n=1 Tax=Stegastes partitus TaxID=144197 RepID=A0A3B5BCD3_9TELE